MGDFTGFTFGNWHSTDSETGLVTVLRVSGGDRYEEELHPEIKDRTAEVPGLNGEYYFGSNYGSRKIDIEIAFDSLTEENFRMLRKVFGTKKPQELIFDERPYKKYIAKIESPVELSYVCFEEPKKTIGTARDGVRRDRENDQETSTEVQVTDTVIVPAGETVSFTLTHTPSGEVSIDPSDIEFEYNDGVYTFTNDSEDSLTITLAYSYTETSFVPAWEQVTPWEYEGGTQRIYKGEGKISFVCYFPFARSVFKELPEEESEEWAISSGILSTADYAAFDTYSSGSINIYNAGDIDTGFRLYLPAAVATAGTTLTYKADGTATTAQLVLKAMTLDSNDVGVLVDTANELIIGVTNATTLAKSNYIYNQYVDTGFFFKFEPNISKNDGSVLEITNGASGITIDYDYLYF